MQSNLNILIADDHPLFRDALANVVLSQSYSGGTGSRLSMVSKLIRARQEREVNRDAFYMYVGGWDTHSAIIANTDRLFDDLNSGLTSFHQEMVDIGMSDSVTVVIGSEFARVSQSLKT